MFTITVLLKTLSNLFAKYLLYENTDPEAMMPQEKESGPCYQIRIENPNIH